MSSIGRYTGRATGGNPGFPLLVRNGRIPQSLLRRLETQPQMPEGERWLFSDAAIGLDAMVRAAALDGVTIELLEAYRTYARQVYFWNLYQSGKGNLAAQPGTSNHGWAVAIDVKRKNNPKALPWMRLHADEYGWDLPDQLGKKEPWHWQWIRGFKLEAALPKPKPTPVYIHGELVPGAFHSKKGDSNILFLRPVVEELGWDVLTAEGATVHLEHDDTERKLTLELHKAADGRAISPARDLCAKLGVECEWRDGAVRIG
jgi:hypothetical protein